jgi:hypothetical protein
LGVGIEAGELRFTETEGPENRVVQSGTSGEGVKVPITTLDELVTDTSLTDEVLVAKIDVEGWEAAVVEGGKDTVLSRTRPTALLLELDGSGARYGFDDDAVHKNLLHKGFTPVEYDPRQRQITQRSRRQEEGNTLYVNDMDIFSQRVRQSKTYSVLGRQI